MKNSKDQKEMIDVKCSICDCDMQMPASFLKFGGRNGIPHICSVCVTKADQVFKEKNMKNIFTEINTQMKKMDKNNDIAEKLAEEITNIHLDLLVDELKSVKAKKEDVIAESFFRGVWTTLFLLGNHHEEGFLEQEAKKIRNFHKKMYADSKNSI